MSNRTEKSSTSQAVYIFIKLSLCSCLVAEGLLALDSTWCDGFGIPLILMGLIGAVLF